MPPAVEPGLPPMSISTSVRRLPDSDRLESSTVLKPAVRGDTDWNSEARTFCGQVRPAMEALRSKSRNSAQPSRSRTPEAVSTSFVWSWNCPKRKRQRTMSRHTRKPRPPMTTRTQTVRFTTGSET